MATCKGCGASIIWIKTEMGKDMPVNLKSEKRYVFIKDHIHTDHWKLADSFMPHWATCPKAKDFKKP